MSAPKRTNVLRLLAELGIDSTTVVADSLGPDGYSVFEIDSTGHRVTAGPEFVTTRKRWRSSTAARLVHEALVGDMIGWGHDNTN